MDRKAKESAKHKAKLRRDTEGADAPRYPNGRRKSKKAEEPGLRWRFEPFASVPK